MNNAETLSRDTAITRIAHRMMERDSVILCTAEPEANSKLAQRMVYFPDGWTAYVDAGAETVLCTDDLSLMALPVIVAHRVGKSMTVTIVAPLAMKSTIEHLINRRFSDHHIVLIADDPRRATAFPRIVMTALHLVDRDAAHELMGVDPCDD